MLPLANILTRKVRTTITAMAVGVGVALFLVLVGLTSMLREIADRTANVDAHIMVTPSSVQVLMGGGLPADSTEAKLRQIPGVVNVVPVLCWPVRMAGRNQNVYGIRPSDWPHFARGEGRLLDGRPVLGGYEMVIDSRLAAAGGYGVGQTVDAWGRKFQIVGIVREGVAGRVFVPIDTLNECQEYTARRATFFYVQADGPASIGPIREAVADQMKLNAFTLAEYYNVLMQTFADMPLVIGAVVFVAGFVCFLVVLLTVYTMVLERTREIGILRGIGASRSQVFGLVMAEAGLISAGGIVAGFLMTWGARALILDLQPLWTIDIPPVRFLYAAALAVVGTFLGALHPALRAARQDPVESLRYE